MLKTKPRFVIALVLVTISSLLSSKAGSKAFFVSPSGNDSNAGVTISSPLRAISGAIRKAAAGDTVYLLPGTYRELISISGKKGKPECPIVLTGYSSDVAAYPVIDGGAVEPSSNANDDWMNIAGSEWLEIARLKFVNGWTFPIKVAGSSYLTFRSCQFRGGKRVINATGLTTHHLLVEECFWDQGGEFLWRVVEDEEGVDAWTSMHHGAMAYFNGSLIDFHGTGGSVVIRRNTCFNGFQAVRYRGKKGGDSNVEIYENHVSNMRDNDFEPEYYTYNLYIYHNVSHNIHKTLSVDNVEGGKIYYYGNIVTADADPWTVKVCTGLWKILARPRFRTFPVYAFNNSFHSSGLAFMSMHGPTEKLQHFNNAYFFFGDGGWELKEWDSGNVFDYDISNRTWSMLLTGNGQEAHGILGEIGFVDPAHGDLRLLPASPGIDAGTVMKFDDLEWKQSYSGTAPDMGAYEDGQLVDGPPFRFLVPPDAKLSYKEKPRIVRATRDGKNIRLYFSDAIDPTSVQSADIELFVGGERLSILSVAFPRSRHELVVTTDSQSTGELSVSFNHFPRGMNGELATYWASAVRIHRPIGTER